MDVKSALGELLGIKSRQERAMSESMGTKKKAKAAKKEVKAKTTPIKSEFSKSDLSSTEADIMKGHVNPLMVKSKAKSNR
jgi:hypothetical protein